MEFERRKARFELWTPEGQKRLVDTLGPVQEQIKDQGNIIRHLKTAKTSDSELKTEIAAIKKLKKQLEVKYFFLFENK